MNTAAHDRARRVRLPARVYGSLGVVVGAAFTCLWLYQLRGRWRAPSPVRARASLGRWCRWAMPWLRLQVGVDGAPSAMPCVYVANHRSYLDIPVLAGVLDAPFLSRADVATWPVIGTVARLTGVIFIERDDPHDRMRATRRLVRQLRTGSVIVFAEGTTTGAPQPGPFHPGLFRLVQRLQVPLVPVTIRYSDRRAYWIEDLGVGQHLRSRVLAGGPLRVAVHIGSALQAAESQDAEALAAAVHVAVCRPIAAYGELA